LTLAIGILAGGAMDVVIQKAVELGVARVVPIGFRRSQAGLRRASARAAHWERVARQALKQCRRAWGMRLSPATGLSDFVADVGGDRGVVADPDGVSPGRLVRSANPVLLIGPEGGFADDESGLLEREGWQRMRLGPYILRAETAAIAGAAIMTAGLDVDPGYTPDP
jgi:16S rRNA (uracil1498-N3)-methyltransferase